MTAYAICKEFGWTYRQFREQPAEVVEAFITILSTQNEEYDRERKRREAKRR